MTDAILLQIAHFSSTLTNNLLPITVYGNSSHSHIYNADFEKTLIKHYCCQYIFKYFLKLLSYSYILK